MSLVKEEDFYRDAHRVILRAILDVHTRNEPVDIITVSVGPDGEAWIRRFPGAVPL